MVKSQYVRGQDVGWRKPDAYYIKLNIDGAKDAVRDLGFGEDSFGIKTECGSRAL